MINRKTCGFKLRQLEKIVESSKIQTLVLMLEKNSVLEIHIQNQMPLIIFHIQVKQEQQPNQSKKKKSGCAKFYLTQPQTKEVLNHNHTQIYTNTTINNN